MMNLDELHFVSNKKKSQFKLKAQIGSFFCNTRVATKEAYLLLKQMQFELSFTWSYDPMGIISKLRVEQKTTPYAHTPRSEIEYYMNQEEWQENTLQEAEEKVFISKTSHTPIPHEKHAKRTRESASPSVLEFPKIEFIMYKKKKKKNPLEEPFQEESSHEQTTLVLAGPHVATFPWIEEIFSSSLLSSVSQDPLEIAQT